MSTGSELQRSWQSSSWFAFALCNLAFPCEGLRDSSSCYSARLDEETLPLCLAVRFLCTARSFFFSRLCLDIMLPLDFSRKSLSFGWGCSTVNALWTKQNRWSPWRGCMCVCLFMYDKVFWAKHVQQRTSSWGREWMPKQLYQPYLCSSRALQCLTVGTLRRLWRSERGCYC